MNYSRFGKNLIYAGILAVATAACGSDSSPTGPGGGGGGGGGGGNSMTATLSGESFQASSATVQGTYVQAQGVVSIMGVRTSGGTTTTVSFNLMGVDGPGTYQFGPNFTGTFGQVIRIQGTDVAGQQTWQTDVPGGSGSVEFTKLDSSGAEGTFSFTANAAPGTAATGTMQVQNGKFKVKFATF